MGSATMQEKLQQLKAEGLVFRGAYVMAWVWVDWKEQFALIEPPELEIDKQLVDHYGPLRPEQKLERKIVANLIHFLNEKGFKLTHVNDGEDDVPFSDAKEAMELVYNLDTAVLYFQMDGHGYHHVLIVNGNGGDCISDYTFGQGDQDGFDAAMEEYFDIVNDMVEAFDNQ